MRIVGQAYDGAKLTEDEAQRVNNTRGLAKLIADFIEESRVADRYIKQQVASTWTYPPEYKGAKDPKTQCQALASLLPGLNPEPNWSWLEAYRGMEIPSWVEGIFAVPSEYAMHALFHPAEYDRADAYCASVSMLMGKIADSRKFYNYRDGQIDKSHLWRSDRTTELMDALWELQGRPDIILMPAQLGMRHRGRSVLRAHECFVASEFGGGSLEGLAIALTHPERFVRWEQLHMDLDDEFSTEADGRADRAPYLYFHDVKVRFRTSNRGNARGYYGMLSCWLPPQ